MIEEKLIIDFEEYLSCFNDAGRLRYAENAQCCIDAINKAVNNFLSGATTVAHHGFNLHGEAFFAKVDVSVSELAKDDDLVSLDISDDCGISAEYIFDATMKLVITKTNDCVVIDSE